MMIAKDLLAKGSFLKELFAKDLVGAQRSIRMHLVVGLAIVMVLTFGIGGWASTQEISGALIAPGQIVVEIGRAHV